MEYLSSVNASMGVMLETTATVDAHAGKRQKTRNGVSGLFRPLVNSPSRSRRVFSSDSVTTWRDRAESILAIKGSTNGTVTFRN